MRSTNFIFVTGNIGSDVEAKKLASGEDVVRLSIAESVSKPNTKTGEFEQVHTNWIPVTAFGSLANRAIHSLKKGDRVTVLGTVKISSYEKDGENRRGFEIIADTIEKSHLLPRANVQGTETSTQMPTFEEFKAESMSVDPMMVK